MQKIESKNEALTKDIITMFTHQDNLRNFFYWSLFSIYDPNGIYMEIETSAKNILNPLHIRITTKNALKKFIKYFQKALLNDEGKVKIVLSDDYDIEEKNIFFSYNKKSINISENDLIFLLKHIANLCYREKIAFVEFFCTFSDNTHKRIFFSEYDSLKIDEFFNKRYEKKICFLSITIMPIEKIEIENIFYFNFN